MLLLALTAALTVSYACGDDGANEGEPAASFPAGNGGDDEAEVEAFDISLLDNAFEPAEFTASGGVIAAFSITNNGVAIHNMRIASGDNEFANEDDAVSDPTLVNGGETATLEWFAPSAGGTFDFRCDFHPQAMVGTITVEPGGDLPDGGTEGP
jgi:plastocyanin